MSALFWIWRFEARGVEDLVRKMATGPSMPSGTTQLCASKTTASGAPPTNIWQKWDYERRSVSEERVERRGERTSTAKSSEEEKARSEPTWKRVDLEALSVMERGRLAAFPVSAFVPTRRRKERTSEAKVASLAVGEEPSSERKDLLGSEGDIEGLRGESPRVERVEEGLVASFEGQDRRGGGEEGGVADEGRGSGVGGDAHGFEGASDGEEGERLR